MFRTQAASGAIDALLEDEAAVETPLAGLDDAIGFPRQVVEGEALDRAHRPGAPLRRVDLFLHLRLHRGDFVGLADDLHPQRRLLDESVEGHDGKDGLCGPARCRIVEPEKFPDDRLPGHGVGREIRVRDDQIVAVAHRPQSVENVGVEKWIDALQHAVFPQKAPAPHTSVPHRSPPLNGDLSDASR